MRRICNGGHGVRLRTSAQDWLLRRTMGGSEKLFLPDGAMYSWYCVSLFLPIYGSNLLSYLLVGTEATDFQLGGNLSQCVASHCIFKLVIVHVPTYICFRAVANEWQLPLITSDVEYSCSRSCWTSCPSS